MLLICKGMHSFVDEAEGKTWIIRVDPRKSVAKFFQSYFSYKIAFRSQPSNFSNSRLAFTIFSKPQM